MTNTSLREAAPTASLRDATHSLLPRRDTLSTSAQLPMTND
ncbi:MAG: hypothetical protein RMZ41_000070 [Nostoc sp. DedVER02]|nr:hypothetical protein [Nostoc sp. DedVER01b]MDZ8114550.1 hypothetical protein [Nostoc sp. DedVER01b]